MSGSGTSLQASAGERPEAMSKPLSATFTPEAPRAPARELAERTPTG